MPTEKQPERGVRDPYQARYGITVGWCRGLNLIHDKSMIGDDELQDGTNVRVSDGIVVNRFGQSAPLNSSALAGCVQGLIDVNGTGPRFVLATVRSDTLANKSDVDLFDRSLTPAYARVTDPPDNNRLSAQPLTGQLQVNGATTDDEFPRYAYLWWNDQIVFDGGDKLYRFIFPEDDLSLDSVQVEPLFDLRVGGSAATFAVASMCTLPETNPNGTPSNNPRLGPPLYFGTVGGGVFAYVNGEMLQLLAEGTFTSRVIVFEFHNRLYAVGRQDLRVQSGWLTGGSPASTTWSSVALPGGITDFLAMCAAEFYGFGWIGGSNEGSSPSGRILKINDSSGSPVVTIGNNGATGNIVCVDDFGIAFGNIYAAYRQIPTATEQANFSTMSNSGSLGAALSAPWSEDGQIIRLLGNNTALYLSAWSTGVSPPGGGGGTSTAIWEWNGTTLTFVVNVTETTPGNPAPYDMVAL